MTTRLQKGKPVLVNWKPSYYRGDTYSSTGIYLGRDAEGKYMVRTEKGVAFLKDRTMLVPRKTL